MARLKSSARLVRAIDAAVRFYGDPPTEAMEMTTPWSEVWIDADDWAVAFDAPDGGTPHNEAGEVIWDQLLTIILDKHDQEVPEDLLRRSLRHGSGPRTHARPHDPDGTHADLRRVSGSMVGGVRSARAGRLQRS